MPVDTSDYQELLDILASRRADIEAYCASSPTWEQLTEWATTNSSYFSAIYGTYLESEQRVKNSLPCLLDDLVADGAGDTTVAYSRLMTELVPAPAQAPQAAAPAEWDEGYQLYRRYNDYLKHYEYAPAEDAKTWECFIDGRWLRYDDQSDSWLAGTLPLPGAAQQPAAGPAPAAAAQWDEGYQLYRRYNDYLKHYEYAPAEDAKTWECFIDGRWLRYDTDSDSWVPGTLPLPGTPQPASPAPAPAGPEQGRAAEDLEAGPAEPQEAATTVEAAAAAAFADADVAALADLDLSAVDMNDIAAEVAAQVAADIAG